MYGFHNCNIKKIQVINSRVAKHFLKLRGPRHLFAHFFSNYVFCFSVCVHINLLLHNIKWVEKHWTKLKLSMGYLDCNRRSTLKFITAFSDSITKLTLLCHIHMEITQSKPSRTTSFTYTLIRKLIHLVSVNIVNRNSWLIRKTLIQFLYVCHCKFAILYWRWMNHHFKNISVSTPNVNVFHLRTLKWRKHQGEGTSEIFIFSVDCKNLWAAKKVLRCLAQREFRNPFYVNFVIRFLVVYTGLKNSYPVACSFKNIETKLQSWRVFV